MRNCKKYCLALLVLVFSGITELFADVMVLNGLTHEFTVTGGSKATGSIRLANASEQVRSVRLYQTDYRFTQAGDSHYDQPGTLSRSNASWITLNQLFVTLQPKEEINVEFELVVPELNVLTGTYWSVIMVEGLKPPDTETSTQGISINTILRYAIQIISHIGDTGSRNLEFLAFDLSQSEGIAQFDVSIGNSGERGLRPELSLELFDENGRSVGIFRADSKRIYPDTSTRFTIPLRDIPPGNYTGVLLADCHDDYIFGTNVSIQL
jgi:hypothetical protein